MKTIIKFKKFSIIVPKISQKYYLKFKYYIISFITYKL